MASPDMTIRFENLDELKALVERWEAVCDRMEALGVPAEQLPGLGFIKDQPRIYCGKSPCAIPGACLQHKLEAGS